MPDLNLPATQMSTIRHLFERKDVQSEIANAVPEILKAENLIRITLTTLRTNEDLMKCSQASLLACLFGCAQLGLTPEPELGLAYLVPFWSSKLQCHEATLIPGYRGLIEISRRSGYLETVEAKPIYMNDLFEVSFGLHPHLKYVPAEENPGELRGAYAIFFYRAGMRPDYDYMPLHEIDKIMLRTKSKDRNGNIIGPWATDKPQMARKCPIRRLWKTAPVSIEDRRSAFMKAIRAEDTAIEIGPEAQRDIFMPYDSPIEITSKAYTVADFDREFADLSAIKPGELDPDWDKYLRVALEANKEEYDTLDEMKIDIMTRKGERQNFRNAFPRFKKDQAEKKSKTTKKTEGDSKGKAKKTRKKAADKAEPAKKPDKGEETPQQEFERLVQSDLWQELSVLKEAHTDVYSAVTKGKDPRTFADCGSVIDEINNITQATQTEIPGA